MEDVEAVLEDVLQGKSDIPVHKVQTPRSSQWNVVSVGETVVVVEFRQILFVGVLVKSSQVWSVEGWKFGMSECLLLMSLQSGPVLRT